MMIGPYRSAHLLQSLRLRIRAVAMPLALGAALCLSANVTASAADTKLSAGDTQFVEDASQADATEIAASKLALTNASDPRVKKFAQQMIADHTKLARGLDVIATQKGLGKAPGADSALVGKLQGLKGADFDRLYVDEVAVGGHQKAVELFQKESETGEDPQLKGAATRALPIIRHHLAMAQQLANAHKASS
jgi:putative membrane protein